jgi:hypothetical protein
MPELGVLNSLNIQLFSILKSYKNSNAAEALAASAALPCLTHC